MCVANNINNNSSNGNINNRQAKRNNIENLDAVYYLIELWFVIKPYYWCVANNRERKK